MEIKRLIRKGDILLRFKKFLFTAIIAFCLLLTGCSNSDLNNLVKSTDQKMTIQKRVGNSDNYEAFKEITDKKKVQKAIRTVKNADRANVKVEMSRYPDYKFQFPFKDRDSREDKIASYSLWVNSNGKKIEIVTDSGKYVELNEQESKDLYKILTEES
jgi:major membrane immunogen (membrane-anchored lipoprotein)